MAEKLIKIPIKGFEKIETKRIRANTLEGLEALIASAEADGWKAYAGNGGRERQLKPAATGKAGDTLIASENLDVAYYIQVLYKGELPVIPKGTRVVGFGQQLVVMDKPRETEFEKTLRESRHQKFAEL